MVLGEYSSYGRALWRSVFSFAGRVPRALADEYRLHDLRTGMAIWESKFRHKQLHVSLGVLGLLQYALGVVPFLGLVRGIQQHQLGVCEGQWCDRG